MEKPKRGRPKGSTTKNHLSVVDSETCLRSGLIRKSSSKNKSSESSHRSGIIAALLFQLITTLMFVILKFIILDVVNGMQLDLVLNSYLAANCH